MIDTRTQEVVATFEGQFSSFPKSLVVSKDGGRLFVVENLSCVTVIDTASGLAVKAIAVKDVPNVISIAPDGNRAYLTYAVPGGPVSVIDLNIEAVVGEIGAWGYPGECAVTPDGNRVYVTSTSTGRVMVADAATNQMLDSQTIVVGPGGDGRGPYSIAITSDYTPVRVAPSVTWATPTDITYGTALSATQLNATADVSGSFSYSPAEGTILNAGDSQTLTVTFTPDDPARYTEATASVNISVLKAKQRISWSNPAAITYGTTLGAAQLNATLAQGEGALIYTPAAGTMLNAGSGQTLRVNVAETADYLPASATVTIDVKKADQTITWNNPAPIVHGTALSSTQLNATVAGAPGGSAPGALSYTPVVGTLLSPGAQQTLSVTAAATDNYNQATATVTIDVRYDWSGVLQPINAAGTRSVFRLGSTVPVKFRLTNASAGITDATASFSYRKVDATAGAVNETATTATPTTGARFQYDASSGQYIYNWRTTGLTTGSYELQIDLGDGLIRTVAIDLR